MRGLLSSLCHRTDGQATVLLALAVVAVMGLAATVVDVATVIVGKERLQDAVDLAALAAGADLPDTQKAVVTATAYVRHNVPNATVTVTFPDAKSVSVSASSSVSYTFARVIGFTSANVVSSGTVAATPIGQALDYTLFSGSKTVTLSLNGSNQYIGGNVHTNKDWDSNGSKLTVTGALEAVTAIRTNGSQINIAQRVPNAPYVPMPDFSETIKTKAQQAGTYFRGNKTYSGGVISVNSPIYIEGDLTVNGSRFTGLGTIVATGNITFNGSSLKGTATDSLAFYAKTGNITINGSQATVDGIMYAPNGQIDMNGSNQTIHGRVVGNTVVFNGSQVTIAGSASDIRALPSNGVKLIH